MAVLKAANIGKQKAEVDAETTPLREPEHYRYDFDLTDIAEVWRRGSGQPGQPVLEERRRSVCAVPHGRAEVRITMTYPVQKSSRSVAFLVAGVEKAEIVRTIRAGNDEVPAARSRPRGELIGFVDRAAWAQVRRDNGNPRGPRDQIATRQRRRGTCR